MVLNTVTINPVKERDDSKCPYVASGQQNTKTSNLYSVVLGQINTEKLNVPLK